MSALDPGQDYEFWQLDIETGTATLSCPEVVRIEAGSGMAARDPLRFWLELADAVERLRFDHPAVGAVVLCWPPAQRQPDAGEDPLLALLAEEVRLAIEDASAHSGQVYVSVLEPGAELAADALAGQYIVAAEAAGLEAEALDEAALERLRRVRRVDATGLAALRGAGPASALASALEHGIIDELVGNAAVVNIARQRARGFAACSDRPAEGRGVGLPPLARALGPGIDTQLLELDLLPDEGLAIVTINGPLDEAPADLPGLYARAARFWPLRLARALDHLLLHLRFVAPLPRVLALRSRGDAELLARYDNFLLEYADDWLARETLLALKRMLWRWELGPWQRLALVEQGSVFCGSVAELLFAADQSVIDTPLAPPVPAEDEIPPRDLLAGAAVRLTGLNFGALPRRDGRTRLAARGVSEAMAGFTGLALDADMAVPAGLVDAVMANPADGLLHLTLPAATAPAPTARLAADHLAAAVRAALADS